MVVPTTGTRDERQAQVPKSGQWEAEQQKQKGCAPSSGQASWSHHRSDRWAQGMNMPTQQMSSKIRKWHRKVDCKAAGNGLKDDEGGSLGKVKILASQIMSWGGGFNDKLITVPIQRVLGTSSLPDLQLGQEMRRDKRGKRKVAVLRQGKM